MQSPSPITCDSLLSTQHKAALFEACNKLPPIAPPQISERALFLRLKRRLARDGIHLKTCREDSRWFNDFGRHYAVNDNNAVHDTHMDIDAWARELGVA